MLLLPHGRSSDPVSSPHSAQKIAADWSLAMVLSSLNDPNHLTSAQAAGLRAVDDVKSRNSGNKLVQQAHE
jgi:hypothetical protein